LPSRFFETFSYLPPLSDDDIAKQVDYIIRQGWIPCLEFSNEEHAYVKNVNNVRFVGSASCGYYDNRFVLGPACFCRLIFFAWSRSASGTPPLRATSNCRVLSTA
jgi:hypothetical protein